MREPIKHLLASISSYMEVNVNMMITHRKMLTIIVALGVMNLAQSILVALMVLKILGEVRR